MLGVPGISIDPRQFLERFAFFLRGQPMMYPRSDLSFAENFLFPGKRKKMVKVKVAFKKTRQSNTLEVVATISKMVVPSW